MNQVDLIIFDCDGVLIDSEIISAKVLIEQMKEIGINVDLPYVLEHFIGRSFPSVAKSIRQTFKQDIPTNFEVSYRHRLLEVFETDLRIMPDIEGVLSRLAVDYCLATSSSPARLKKSLELVGLTDRFDKCHFTASQVDNGKPAPDLFLMAATEMGHLPKNCLVIEDSPSGIFAGQAAGMSVWKFTGGSHFRINRERDQDEFPEIKKFDSWSKFFSMAPFLEKPAR